MENETKQYSFEPNGLFVLEPLRNAHIYPYENEKNPHSVHFDFIGDQYLRVANIDDAHSLAKLLGATEYKISKIKDNALSFYHSDVVFMTPLVEEMIKLEETIKLERNEKIKAEHEANRKRLEATPKRQILMHTTGDYVALVLDWSHSETDKRYYTTIGFIESLDAKEVKLSYDIVSDFVSSNNRVMRKKIWARLAGHITNTEIEMFQERILGFVKMHKELRAIALNA